MENKEFDKTLTDIITDLAYIKENMRHTQEDEPIDFSYVHGFEEGFKEALKTYNIWKPNTSGMA